MKNTIDDLPSVLTPIMVSQVLMIGLNSTYLLLKRGEIKSVRIGKQHRVSKESLIEYLRS